MGQWESGCVRVGKGREILRVLDVVGILGTEITIKKGTGLLRLWKIFGPLFQSFAPLRELGMIGFGFGDGFDLFFHGEIELIFGVGKVGLGLQVIFNGAFLFLTGFDVILILLATVGDEGRNIDAARGQNILLLGQFDDEEIEFAEALEIFGGEHGAKSYNVKWLQGYTMKFDVVCACFVLHQGLVIFRRM
ncbi:MAG: hypothetical protein JWQ71_3194 [Pedosphaera sp.]|nr:hypothetical protein [Pedosphaera sp.]